MAVHRGVGGLVLSALLCCSSFFFIPSSAWSTSLDGKWTLSNSNGSLKLSAVVPGCVHTALQQQGFIQDPYFRFNDLLYRWIVLDNWTYTTQFHAFTGLRKQKVLLVFDGVDTVSSISLNGVVLGWTDNMFRRYVFPITKLLQDKKNVLEVSVLSPVLYASERHKAHAGVPVPPDCPPDTQKGECHVNFIRKEQCSFSWDWGPSFPTMGLFRGVHLVAFDLVHLVHMSCVSLYNATTLTWTVQVELLVEAATETSVLLTLSIPELQSELSVQSHFVPGRSLQSFMLDINKETEVLLWWPRDHGDRHGYHLTVRGQQDSHLLINAESKVFFRTVELVQQPLEDSKGLSFYFRINGRPIFLKGSNWIPAHSFQDQVTPNVLKNLLQSAADANMNALRVWGGGVYEQEYFYNICDELGIMVWQDMMFACAMYPTDQDFINTVREEVIQQVRRLKSHPSVVIWSGNNENEAALATDWFHIPSSLKPRYMREYVMLYVDNIRVLVQKEDPSRPFLVSSPTNGAESQQEGWVAANPYDPLYGDIHFYSYTDNCWDWRNFPRTRFASEYGFQSWPSFSTLQPVSVKEDWNYSSPFSAHRQHHTDGNQQMLKQAALHFQLPNSSEPLQRFTDTLYITQVMQAQCVKVQTEFYRRSRSKIIEGKGHTMGALYWQLNDIWQAPSWSSIEFGGKWKMLHYFAQSFFAPVLPVGFEDDDDSFVVVAVSDLHQHLKLQAIVTVYRWSSQDSVCTLSSDWILVPAGSAFTIFSRPIRDLLEGCGRCTRRTCLITFQLWDNNGQKGPSNHHFLDSPKDAEGIQRPNITAEVRQTGQSYTVTLHSAAVAAFVWLDVGSVSGRFDSNGFLLVERNKTLTFSPWRPTSVEELTASLKITSLRDVY